MGLSSKQPSPKWVHYKNFSFKFKQISGFKKLSELPKIGPDFGVDVYVSGLEEFVAPIFETLIAGAGLKRKKILYISEFNVSTIHLDSGLKQAAFRSCSEQ